MRFRRRKTSHRHAVPRRYSWLASAERQETVLAFIGLDHLSASALTSGTSIPLGMINKQFSFVLQLGLCESRLVLLGYSVEYLIEYSSSRRIPEVVTNDRVVENKRNLVIRSKFVVRQRSELIESKIMPETLKHSVKPGYNCNVHIWDEISRTDRHRKWQMFIFKVSTHECSS